MPQLSVPSSIAEVTPAWLSAALAKAFPGSVAHSFRAKRIGKGFGLSSEIHRIELDGNGAPESVVLKLWSADGPAWIREVQYFQESAT